MYARTGGKEMDQTTKLARMTLAIAQRIGEVYHLTAEKAMAALMGSGFYALLKDPKRGFLEDDVERNFRRYQNEIEYGAWNRNEDGGIVE